MINPYVVSGPVTGEHFYGRQALIAEIVSARQRAVFVLGMRQIGKTSLLRQVETLVPALFLDVQFAGGRLSHLSRQLKRELRRKGRRHAWMQSVPAADEDDVFGLIEAVNDTAEEHGQTVWVLMDETEGLLAAARSDPALLQRLRGALQNCPALRAVLVSGKTLSEADALQSAGMSPFFSGFALRYLGGLAPAAAAALIRQQQSEGAVEAGDALVADLLDVTGGHPLLLQLLCHDLFEGGRLRPLCTQDVDKVLNTVRHLGILDADFRYLSAAERAVLRAVLETGRAAGADPTYLHGLTQLGYLRQAGDGYAIGNEFLARWLPSAAWEASSDISDEGTLRLYRPTELHELIDRHFDLEELRTLCFRVGVDYDSLRGEGKAAKIRELILYLQRQGGLERLVAEARRRRKGGGG